MGVMVLGEVIAGGCAALTSPFIISLDVFRSLVFV